MYNFLSVCHCQLSLVPHTVFELFYVDVLTLIFDLMALRVSRPYDAYAMHDAVLRTGEAAE